MSEIWITTKQASERSGYHPEHIRRLIREGKVRAHKFGPVWQVDRISLQTYLDGAEHHEDGRWGPHPK